MNLVEIRTAVCTYLKDTARVANVFPRLPNVTPRLPFILVTPSTGYVTYSDTMDGLAVVNLAVSVYTQGTAEGSDQLDEFLSAGTDAPSSLVDLLEAAGNLGGRVEYLFVSTAETQGRVNIGSENAPVLAWVGTMQLELKVDRAS